MSVGLPVRADRVSDDFARRKAEFGQTGCFAIFDSTLTADERQALEFLYAYMPLPDLTDRSGSFYRQNVDVSLRARKEMPWGKTVPEREFRHFVLPVRVNNEALDSSRVVFYDMLKDRVRNLSMRDAVVVRPMRGRIHIHRSGPACRGHPGPPGLHPALGPHR